MSRNFDKICKKLFTISNTKYCTFLTVIYLLENWFYFSFFLSLIDVWFSQLHLSQDHKLCFSLILYTKKLKLKSTLNICCLFYIFSTAKYNTSLIGVWSIYSITFLFSDTFLLLFLLSSLPHNIPKFIHHIILLIINQHHTLIFTSTTS